MKFAQHVVVLMGMGVLALTMSACGTNAPPTLPATLIPTPVPLPTTAPLPPALTATPIPTATRTTTPTLVFTPTRTHKDLLSAAFTSALSKIKTYRVKVAEESREIDVILPDRFAQVGWDPIVRIGGTVYMYDARGNLLTGNASNLPFFDRASIPWFKERFAESPQIILLGPTTIDGTPCIGYSGTFAVTKIVAPKTPEATPQTTQMSQPVKIWFATSDGFPRRVEMGAPVPLSITFYDYNGKMDPIEPLN
jgi:hypothetical protein